MPQREASAPGSGGQRTAWGPQRGPAEPQKHPVPREPPRPGERPGALAYPQGTRGRSPAGGCWELCGWHRVPPPQRSLRDSAPGFGPYGSGWHKRHPGGRHSKDDWPRSSSRRTSAHGSQQADRSSRMAGKGRRARQRRPPAAHTWTAQTPPSKPEPVPKGMMGTPRP